jgi:hypothetical protein
MTSISGPTPSTGNAGYILIDLDAADPAVIEAMRPRPVETGEQPEARVRVANACFDSLGIPRLTGGL